MRLGNLQKNNYNYFSGFSNGVLMVLVSTPCMAPFLGVSLGYALSQSATTSLIAFTFVAIGLSSPYLFFSHISANAQMATQTWYLDGIF